MYKQEETHEKPRTDDNSSDNPRDNHTGDSRHDDSCECENREPLIKSYEVPLRQIPITGSSLFDSHCASIM